MWRRASGRILFLGWVGLFSLMAGASASEVAPEGTPERKFQRGLLNVAFAPLEISEALDQDRARREEFPSWVVLGIGRGAFLASLRALSGIYEIVTFPLPIPPRYEPIVHPEFALKYLGLMENGSPQEKTA